MKRLLGTLALLATTAAAAPSMAQEIQIRGPLAGAPAVSRLVHYRERRIALTPTFGMTIQDEFSREMFFGLRAEYHVTDWLGIGVWGAIAPVHIDTALTDQVVEQLGTNSRRTPMNGGNANVPTGARFSEQVGRRNWMADIHVTFIPLRGKFALFQNVVADVDFFVFAGPTFIGVEERADYNGAASIGSSTDPAQQAAIAGALNRNQLARASRVAVTGTFGAGLNFYINRFLSVNIEYRAFPFAWNTSGTDEDTERTAGCGAQGNEACEGFSDIIATQGRTSVINSTDQLFHFNQMVNFGLTFYLPTRPRVGQ